jgi:hypothetical protein
LFFTSENTLQGRIQDFKLGGGGALKKIAPSEGMHENFWGISCEKSRFYAKKSYFFQLQGGARRVRPPPPGSVPAIDVVICTHFYIVFVSAEQHLPASQAQLFDVFVLIVL